MGTTAQRQRVLGRLLVTGGTGFVGRAVVGRVLPNARSVTVLTRNPEWARSRFSDYDVHLLAGDMTRPESLFDACADIDTVVHCAGHAHAFGMPARESDRLHFATTVEGTRALLAAATRAEVKCVVFISSVKAMGEWSPECLDEDAEPRPSTPYGKAKLEAEELVLKWGTDPGRHAAVLRLPLVYGVESAGNIPRMIDGIDRGWFPPLPEVHNKRSMVHVEDVAEAVLCVAVDPRAAGHLYLVTDGRPYSTAEICDEIRRALGRRRPRWTVPITALRLGARAGDVLGRLRGRPLPFDSQVLDKLLGSAWYSSRRIRDELGFEPRHTLFDTLPAMVAGRTGGRHG